MKKEILTGMILISRMSSFGFSTGKFDKNMNNKCDNNRNEINSYGKRSEKEKNTLKLFQEIK